MKRTARDVVSMCKYGDGERTETSTNAALETLSEIVDLDSRFAAAPPIPSCGPQALGEAPRRLRCSAVE